MISILSIGSATPADTISLRARPEFRKATLKMQLACLSMSQAIEGMGEWLREASDLGFVLNSGYGEIEATAEFLKTLSESGLARPVLFQNSLHNSTTGFAAIQFKITGPVVTVNHRAFGGEHALWTAESLLAAHECKFCFVTSVETVPKEFGEEAGTQGSTTLLLADHDWALANNYKPLANLDSVSILTSANLESLEPKSVFQSLYDLDPVYLIAQKLARQNFERGSFVIDKTPLGTSGYELK